MTALKLTEARGTREKTKNEDSWCMVSQRGEEGVEAAEGNWARVSEACTKSLDSS